MAYKDLASIAPYFDDFDEAKAFYAMLYNPSRAVQARELTQMQTILQNQVKSFANHIFKDNSIVVNANIDYSFDKKFLKLTDNGAGTPSQDLQNFLLNTVISDQSGGTTAKVTHIDQTNFLVYFDYISGKGFDDTAGSTTLGLITSAGDLLSIVVDSLSNATVATSEKGIVYAGGFFVIVNQQEIIVDSAINGYYRIGFNRVESSVTAAVDATLGDPANGTNNAAQPGADRFKIDLVLSAYVEGVDVIPANFIEFLVINKQLVIKRLVKPEFGPILDLLARRTFDESGDYIVKPFRLVLEDHATDATKLTANLQPGKAFVLGYEVDKTLTTSINIDKSRNFQTSVNNTIFADYGQYIIIAFNDADSKFQMSFSAGGTTPEFTKGIVLEVMDGINGGGTVLGTVRTTSFKRTADELRLYITDNNNVVTSIGSAQSLRLSANNWSANLHRPKGFTELLGVATAPILEYSEFDVVKDLTDITYEYQGQFSGITVNASNELTISGGVNDEFGNSSFVLFLQNRTTNELAEFSNLSVVGAGTSNITITNSATAFTIGHVYDVILRIIKTVPIKRTKTLITPTEALADTISVAFSDVNGVIYPLTEEDALPLQRIIQTNNFINGSVNDAAYDNTVTPLTSFNGADARDVTSAFNSSGGKFNNGQTAYYYDVASVSGMTSAEMKALTSGGGTTSYAVVYDHYVHSTGTTNKFFIASSYPNFDTIGSFTTEDGAREYNLTNSVDFRFKLSQITQTPQYPYQESTLLSDVDFFLARIDKIFLTRDGKFGVHKGISSTNPDLPNDINNAIILYTLAIPAYTYDRNNIFVKEIDHRRYTMRDIGDLDKRLSNVEEYAALSLLEKSATDLVIQDVNGLDMFKAGIFVDSFSNYITHEIDDPEYDFVIDPLAGIGKGSFYTDFSDLQVNSLINTTQHENTITISYTIDPIPMAENVAASDSININPFLFYQWNGNVKLTPAVDMWVDVLQLPAILNSKTITTIKTVTKLVLPVVEVKLPVIVKPLPVSSGGIVAELNFYKNRIFGKARDTVQPFKRLPAPIETANTGQQNRSKLTGNGVFAHKVPINLL